MKLGTNVYHGGAQGYDLETRQPIMTFRRCVVIRRDLLVRPLL